MHQKANHLGTYNNEFLCVHDDTFGRAFRNTSEIADFFRDRTRDSFLITAVSTNSDGCINVFHVMLRSKKPINSTDDYKVFESLLLMKCYNSQPCDFKPAEEVFDGGTCY